MTSPHSFHIPVMGTGYTLDTALKVAHYGIDSVLSLNDDTTIERLRKKYSLQFGVPYEEITKKDDDCRAKRITAYLNLLNKLANEKLESIKNSPEEAEERIKYFEMLPEHSPLKQEFLKQNKIVTDELKNQMVLGSIDVNIMTKLDKENYIGEDKLPSEYNNAHSALRGYAQSDLSSSIVFSAGMNPSLYSYVGQFEDFYPDQNMNLRKKIVLKVSDYRSALVQGKFFAKKGLWVSEYRIESGLNCGGHAFATDGYLMGPILAEFRDHRQELQESLHEIFVKALAKKNLPTPSEALPIKVTAQGGVGTAEEHELLLNHYNIDSVGWGTPFLLVPEATAVDEDTLQRLVEAKEKDLYLSNVSPIGVPFNNLRSNTKNQEKMAMAKAGRPGSPCPRKFLSFNREYSDKGICTASRQYQSIKIKELNQEDLSLDEYQKRYNKIVEKECLCVGLVTANLSANGIKEKSDAEGVSICPGPNLAYFSKIMTLQEIVGHIYARTNVITRTDRPNFFIKELGMYLDYLKECIEEIEDNKTNKNEEYLTLFTDNLKEGIQYYYDLFDDLKSDLKSMYIENTEALDASKLLLDEADFKLKNAFDSSLCQSVS